MDIDNADSRSAIYKHTVARRRLVLKTLSGSALFGGVVDKLPGMWQRPLIHASVLPTHAQASGVGGRIFPNNMPDVVPTSTTASPSPVLKIISVAVLDAAPVADLSFPFVMTEAAVAAASDRTVRIRLAVTGLVAGEALDVHFTLDGDADRKDPDNPDAAYDYAISGADFIAAEQRYRVRATASAPEVEFRLSDLAAFAPDGEAAEVLVVILDARPGDGYQVDTGRNAAVIEFRDTIFP